MSEALKDEGAISEAASENGGKRKRGRPPRFNRQLFASDEQLRTAYLVFSYSATTDRARQNVRYAALAFLALDKEAISTPSGDFFNPGVLAELGRVLAAYGLETANEVGRSHSDGLREEPQTVKEQQAALRQWRLGQEGTASREQLVRELVNAVNRLLARYPETPASRLREAIAEVYDRVRAVAPSHEG